jgi:hypothetical protein
LIPDERKFNCYIIPAGIPDGAGMTALPHVPIEETHLFEAAVWYLLPHVDPNTSKAFFLTHYE